jgi:hypothetical protein
MEIETLSHNFEVFTPDGKIHYSGPSIEIAAAMRRTLEGAKIKVFAQVSLNEDTMILMNPSPDLNEQEG